MAEALKTIIGLEPRVINKVQSINDIGEVFQAMRAGEMTIAQGKTAYAGYKTEVLGVRQALSLARIDVRNQNIELMLQGRIFSNLASMGNTLLGVYTTFTLMQTRLADETRDVRDAEERLVETREAMVRMAKELGTSNLYYTQLVSQETNLTKRLTAEKEDLSRAQQQNIVGYVGMGLSMLGIVNQTAILYVNYSNLIAAGGKLWNPAPILTAAGSVATVLEKVGLLEAALILAAAAGAKMTGELLMGKGVMQDIVTNWQGLNLNIGVNITQNIKTINEVITKNVDAAIKAIADANARMAEADPNLVTTAQQQQQAASTIVQNFQGTISEKEMTTMMATAAGTLQDELESGRMR